MKSKKIHKISIPVLMLFFTVFGSTLNAQGYGDMKGEVFDVDSVRGQLRPIWQGDVSTFDWDYTQTETCLIIEGKVTVTDRPAGEDSVTLGAGDMVIFPVGLACVWEIEEGVRKYYDVD